MFRLKRGYPPGVDGLLVGLGSLLMGLSLWGCAPVPTLEDSQLLRLNLTVAPASLDPAQARDQAMVWMAAQLYSGLVELDEKLTLKPALAKRWQLSADGRSYIFTLWQGVYFCEEGGRKGRAVVAADFVYSFTRICNPGTASPGQWIFNGRLVGVEAYQAGKVNSIQGLQAPNDSTLVVQLQARFPPFLALLAMPYAAVVPQEAVQRSGTDFRSHPVGTGPFYLAHWEVGRQLALRANPHYYEPGLPKLQAVQVRFIPSRLTAFHELLRGRLDFLEGLDPALKDELFTPSGELQATYQGRFQLYNGPQLTTEYLGFLLDSRAPTPWQDVRVRRAISLAINRPKLVRYLRNNQALPALASIVPPSLPGYANQLVKVQAYNPSEAARLLAQAGYTGGQGLPVLTLISSPSYQPIAEFLQKALSEIGIKLEIESLEGAAGRELIYGGKAQLWRASWVADYPDAENFLALFYGPNAAPAGPNTTRYHSPAYDSLYQAALGATSGSLRYQLYQTAQYKLSEDVPAIFLFYYKIFRIYGNNVQGLRNGPLDTQLLLKYVYKRK